MIYSGNICCCCCSRWCCDTRTSVTSNNRTKDPNRPPSPVQTTPSSLQIPRPETHLGFFLLLMIISNAFRRVGTLS